MEPRNPNYQEAVTAIFDQADFVRELGIDLVDSGPGWCEAKLILRDSHRQQHGFVHAGVQATLADHTAGAAATTLAAADQAVLSVEFKINLLRPAVGEFLSCRAEVLRAGRNLSVIEASVYAHQASSSKLVSKAMLTMTATERRD